MSHQFGSSSYHTVPAMLQSMVEDWCADLVTTRRATMTPKEITDGMMEGWQLAVVRADKDETDSHMSRHGYDRNDLLEAVEAYADGWGSAS